MGHNIEAKLPKMIGTIAQVLETCNRIAKSIHTLNSTILEFMQQMQANGVNVGSPEVHKHAIVDVNMPIEMVENEQVHVRKGKIWPKNLMLVMH
jgi:hypothetical protein